MRYTVLFPLACVFTQAACSPLDSSRISTGAPVQSTSYETFNSTADATSNLAGVALQLRENPDRVQLRDVTGSKTHNTGETTIDDGTYNLVDPDGLAANGLLTDGVSALIITPAQGFSTNYGYVRAYTQTYVSSGTAYSVEGVVGIVTLASDMPSSGSANWTGEAEGNFKTAADTVDLDNGSASVTANFGTGRMSVRMEGFDPVSRDTGRSTSVGFDAVEINGMRISGNRFSGGTMTTLDGTSSVSVVGTRAQQDTGGRFYGLDSASTPDEVGGIGYLRGADGSVSVIFLAD